MKTIIALVLLMAGMFSTSVSAAPIQFQTVEVRGDKVILIENGVPVLICTKSDETDHVYTGSDCRWLPAGNPPIRIKPNPAGSFTPAALIKTGCTPYYCMVIRRGPYLFKVSNCVHFPCYY